MESIVGYRLYRDIGSKFCIMDQSLYNAKSGSDQNTAGFRSRCFKANNCVFLYLGGALENHGIGIVR